MYSHARKPHLKNRAEETTPAKAGFTVPVLQQTVGNRILSEALKLAAPGENAAREHLAETQADIIADLGTERLLGGSLTPLKPELVTRNLPPAGGGIGGLIPHSVRRIYEPMLGYDLSRVRVHSGEESHALTSLLRVRAMAFGNHIYIGKGAFQPASIEGQKLLGHELTHVAQQAEHGRPCIQRQNLPPTLQTSVNYREFSDEELFQRYDLISRTLTGGPLSQLPTSTTIEMGLLEDEAGRIGVEVSRRTALRAGRTFEDADITRMKDFFVRNAASSNPLSCIAAMNKGMRLVLEQPALSVGSSVEATMGRIHAAGFAEAPREIWFNDSRGRLTRGARRPHELQANVWDTVLEMAGHDVGWSVFGLSLLDGYHSVTLTLDHSDPSQPKIFWSDQWSSKGGWKEMTRSSLNSEITSLIQGWWDPQPVGRKHTTRITLWRVRPVAPGTAPP